MENGSAALAPLLSRVKISNYRSIGKCDVALHRLGLLVGRNGSGKSNFLDAIRFVSDGLQTSLDHAIKSRGGIQAVRRKSTGHPRNFAIQLQLNLPENKTAAYGFEVAARTAGGFGVRHEELTVRDEHGRVVGSYLVKDGEIVKSSELTPLPQAVSDRLFLVVASGIPKFRSTYDALLAMGFYNLNPEAMRGLQSPDAGELLHRDGGNIASVIGRIAADNQAEKERSETYLSRIVPGVVGVDRTVLGPMETLEFRQEVEGAEHPWKFLAASMSDGTLRALGTLIAIAQLSKPVGRVRLVGIEEPETALHPAASQALVNALAEATEHTQVIVTTHSTDLLAAMDFEPDRILVVQSVKGETSIGALDRASIDAVKGHLYDAGEMLRMDQFQVDELDLQRQQQMELFTDGAQS
jgi:predicted ATPase